MARHRHLEELRRLRQTVDQQLGAAGGFAARLRDLRRRREMTLEALARAAGISKAYLSQIENGQVEPPREEKLRRLERVFGERPGSLVELAHLERMPEDVRRRLLTLRSAFSRAEETVETLLRVSEPPASECAPDAPADNAESPRVVQARVPIINRVAAGYPAEFTDLGYPAGVADEYIGAPPDLDDGNAFAVRVVGDSMAPRYREGDIVLFSPAAPIRSGDDCYVRFCAGCSLAEGATFKRVYFDNETTARLQPLNGQYPPTVAPLAEIDGLYKAVYRYEAL